MKLQRTTLMLLVSALLLGGVVYYSEIQRTQKQEAVKTTKPQIFYFKEDEIKALTIYIDEETLELERVSGKSTDYWQMKMPKDFPASNAAVAFLVNLLVNGKSERRFTVPATQNKLQEYGLDKPLATIRVQLKNQQIHRLILGKPDFNRSFLYAQADPSNQTPQPLEVLLVPIDFEYAVTRPLSEWQSQQKQSERSKPSPTPTNSKSSPTPKSSIASPTPANSKASPTPKSSIASPTPANSKASPTPKSSIASPTPANSKASPTPKSSIASPTPANSKASPTPKSSIASPTPANSKASPTPKSSIASPTPASSQQSPAKEKS